MRRVSQRCPEQQGEYLNIVHNSEESISALSRTSRRVSKHCSSRTARRVSQRFHRHCWRVSQHCPEQRREHRNVVQRSEESISAGPEQWGEYSNLSRTARRVSQGCPEQRGEYLNIVQNSEESISGLSRTVRRVSQGYPEQPGEYLKVVQNSEESILMLSRTARRVSQHCP